MKPKHVPVILVASVVLASCNMTARMDVPVISRGDPVEVPASGRAATIAFEKALAKIKRGTVIAHFPSASNAGFNVTLCNQTYADNATLEWGGGNRHLSGWDGEMGQAFYEAMSGAGYAVVGDPSEPFLSKDERDAADYLIAARIVEMRGNFCEEHDFWTGRPRNRFAGEFYMKVEWVMYSPGQREIVATFRTEGYAKQAQATNQGIMNTFLSSFADATQALAVNKEFIDRIWNGNAREPEVASAGYEPLSLEGSRKSRTTIHDRIDMILDGTATIRRGRQHGSGFVLDSSGFLLTNQHVVGSAAKVLVVFRNGMEIEGDVIRADKARDVALIKIPVKGLSALPIGRTATLENLAPVYAVGTPLTEALRATVTKGIVSAFREDKKSGLTFIQSDVDVSGGNSGGPLLDEFGNVVGVSVAGFGFKSFSAGLNLFIPIEDALRALNLTVSSPST